MLRTDGPALISMLSDHTDEAPGNVSYHLSKLAEHGLIVEAPELARDAGNGGGGRRTRTPAGPTPRSSTTQSDASPRPH